MNSPPMELDIWKGDWGLASVDLDCLRLVAFCKFADAKVQLNCKNHTLTTPKSKLPVFRHGKKTLCRFEEITNHLLKKNLTPDHGLPEKYKADAIAFTSYLKESLYPAILYSWWLDEKNRMNLIRKWYAKTVPFPLNFYYPDQYHEQAKDRIQALFPNIEDEKMLENEIYKKAQECLEAVSQRLGSQDYMFGQLPTSIDATLYAYLALIYQVPLPNCKLRFQGPSCSNLVKYVNRISKRYFAAETQAFEAQKQKDQVAAQTDAVPPRYQQVLGGTVAILAMIIYAISTGLISVPRVYNRRKQTNPSRTMKMIPIRYES